MGEPPKFNGDYFIWKLRMRVYLQSLGPYVWFTVQYGWTVPTCNDQPKPYSSWSEDEKSKSHSNNIGLQAIFVAVSGNPFSLTALCTTSKQAWDTLESFYEGDEYIKYSALNVLDQKFVAMTMQEDEKFEEFYLRLLDVVNRGRALGHPYSDTRIALKILNSFPKRFESARSHLGDAILRKRMTLDSLMEI